MKKINYKIIVFILFYFVGYSQNRKGQFHLTNESQHHLYISFGNALDLKTYDYLNEIKKSVPEIKILENEYHFTLQKGIAINDENLKKLEIASEAISKNSQSVKKLKNIFKIDMPNSTNEKLFNLATKLEKIEAVEYCDLISEKSIAPPSNIAAITPNFEANQTYIQSNPGVNMQYAWNLGLNGNGIRIRDVEYGFNKNHEELNNVNASLAVGMDILTSLPDYYTDHGTAVFGISYANKGTYGISGLAYGAQEMILFPQCQQSGCDNIYAISQAIENSHAGDVLILEMQESGQNGYYVPAEFDNLIWDLTKAATDAGIIVVGAAGNGHEDLDSSYYSSYRDRGNSGAIIVGAGSPDLFHSILSFSTHGSRVDTQGWGFDVITSGFGDWSTTGGNFNQTYTNFTGTSSATAMVSPCIVVLQSYYFSLTGNYLTSNQMKTLLQETGIPQYILDTEHIGPLPNMQEAIQKIYNDYLKTNSYLNSSEFMVYPNPCQDKVTLITSDSISYDPLIKITNSIGQIIYDGILTTDKTINLSNFPSGFYFVQLTDKNRTSIKKIIKK